MRATAPIFLIVVAVGGFYSGAIIDGELEPHSFAVPKLTLMNFFENAQMMTFIQSASLSGSGQAIIDHATIDFGFDTLTNAEGYFENVLNECIFSSGESFGGEIFYGDEESADNGVCIICKIKGECVDVDEGFDDLDHGTRLGAINSELADDGIFLTVDARPGGHDTAIIFDGDAPGDNDENPTPDPDLRASGICTGCAGLKMLIIPEKIDDDVTNEPTKLPNGDPNPDFPGGDPPPDGLVDVPDDSAAGGTMKFQFELPRKIVSFDFIDMDRPSAAVHEARAYSDFSCTQLIDSEIPNTSGEVPIPNGVDGNVQTISMPQPILDAGARCLEIEAHDSFGVTNLVLECIGISMDGNILGVGRQNLPNGYTANDRIHLPMDPPISVFEPQHVDIEIVSTNLNFHGLDHGDVLNNQFFGTYGIKISGNVTISTNPDVLVPRDPVVFNTELAGTSDPDLEVDVGNISIVQENTVGCGDGTCDDPDDNAAGGEQYFQFNPKRHVNSLVWIDADRGGVVGTVFLYSDYDCTTEIDAIDIPSLGDESIQVLVPINTDQVGCLVADYHDSGGLSKINLGCPLPEDPITMPWFKGEHQGSSSEESIYFTSFPSDPSDDPNEGSKWTLENIQHLNNGHSFGILNEPNDNEWDAFAGNKVLAGSGIFTPEVSYVREPIDISNYHSVVVSVQYNHEDTEGSQDTFFLEYKDGANWDKIVDVQSPQSSPGQLSWTLAEEDIPDSINSLELRFRWTTSSNNEHVMIDNLEILGIPN